jgi:hypothetical protein
MNKSVHDSLGGCPVLYKKISGSTWNQLHRNTVYANVNSENDLSGTICGMKIDGTTDGLTCDGYNPGMRQCPPGYSLRYTMFNMIGYFVCVKD